MTITPKLQMRKLRLGLRFAVLEILAKRFRAVGLMLSFESLSEERTLSNPEIFG